MDYRMDEAVGMLRRTPGVLRALLAGVPDSWARANEGPETWSPYDVVGHLIHGERAAWVPRAEHILAHGAAVPFAPFDREAMFLASRGKSMDDLLDMFTRERADSLERLAGLRLGEADLERQGTHPAYGSVTMRQLLATWVVHDLAHLAQITRVLARQYGDVVGPWAGYLPILKPRGG